MTYVVHELRYTPFVFGVKSSKVKAKLEKFEFNVAGGICPLEQV